jgi:serine/threonine-protein kinase
VIVGVDGVARVLDFGVAKATGRAQTTREGQVKGKLAYMAPEQLRGQPLSRQADLYAAAVVLWEVLAGRRLFAGDNEGRVVEQVLFAEVEPPSKFAPEVSPALDAVVARGLARDRDQRFRSAREMANAVQDAAAPATPHEVGEWVERMADDALSDRQQILVDIDRSQPAGGAAAIPSSEQQITATSLFGPELVASQISNISSATPTTPALRRKTRTLQIAAIALAAAVIGTAIGASLRGNARSETAERAPKPEPSIEAQPSPATLTPPDQTRAKPSTSAVSAPTPAPKAAATAKKRATTTTNASCNPPFVRDEEGRKIYKRECLK